MEKENQLRLLRTNRFLPLLITQFLGAFNDNIFKNALIILATYKTAEAAGLNVQLLVTAATGIFILPFFLFSALAGQVADKFEKSRLIRFIKLAEIVLMVLASIGFATESLFLLMLVLFLMGTQSTFFGPLKYSILPDHLEERELIGGNAFIETSTFLSILIGTIVGGLLILTEKGVLIISLLLLGLSITGYLASRKIPLARTDSPNLRISTNFVKETTHIIKLSAENRPVFLSILGISWFWLIGVTFLAQFPNYTMDVIVADEQVVTLFMSAFSVGIGVGSLLCNRLLKGMITAKYVPFAAIFLSIFCIDLYFSSHHAVRGSEEELLSLGAFLIYPANWRITADLLMIAIAGGVYIVPLYAIMQARSEKSARSRIIAANNILNALFMVVATVYAGVMLGYGFTLPDIFLVIGILNGFIAFYIAWRIPERPFKSLFIFVMRSLKLKK